MVVCIHSGHEPSALCSKLLHLNATVCFGDVDLDRGSIMSHVEQFNLLHDVSIVPTLLGQLPSECL